MIQQIQDENFDKLYKNHQRLLQRIESIDFDLSDETNAAIYQSYEEKMVLNEQLKGLKKDIENAKTLVLTVFTIEVQNDGIGHVEEDEASPTSSWTY